MHKTISYKQALSYLDQISRQGPKPGLDRMRRMLQILDNPQNDFSSILIGGTNGKGSTTYMLSNILKKAGLKVGTFISPPILSFRERIQLDLEWISEEGFIESFQEVKKAVESVEDRPSFFEFINLMAIVYFSKKDVDYAVFEVGMGGRLDSTNSVEPILSIITSISLDHTIHLGERVEKIAYEKAHIAREGRPLICSVVNNKAKKSIFSHCERIGAVFIDSTKIDREFDIVPWQQQNAKTAYCAAVNLRIDEKTITDAINESKIPARMQRLSENLYIDTGHNPGAAKHLLPTIKKEFRDADSILVYSCMKDKDHNKVLRLISSSFDSIFLVRLDMDRAEDPKVVYNTLKKIGFAGDINIINPKDLQKSIGEKKTLIFGSIYLLQTLFGDPSINQPN